MKATKSMQNDIQMFKSKLEILLARFDLWSKLQNDALLQNGTPVAARGASAEPLITGAAPAELLSTRAEPCARSKASSSRTQGPEAKPETEPEEEADYSVEDSDEWLSDY